MNSRNWSIIIVLVLANYLVFSTLAVLVFPLQPLAAPTHAPQPTVTPGALPLQRVSPLPYDFLTPSPTPTVTGAPITVTPTRQP